MHAIIVIIDRCSTMRMQARRTMAGKLAFAAAAMEGWPTGYKAVYVLSDSAPGSWTGM